jgi:hypothetical protein
MPTTTVKAVAANKSTSVPQPHALAEAQPRHTDRATRAQVLRRKPPTNMPHPKFFVVVFILLLGLSL